MFHIKKCWAAGMVAPGCNPSMWEAETSKSEVGLSIVVTSNAAWATV